MLVKWSTSYLSCLCWMAPLWVASMLLGVSKIRISKLCRFDCHSKEQLQRNFWTEFEDSRTPIRSLFPLIKFNFDSCHNFDVYHQKTTYLKSESHQIRIQSRFGVEDSFYRKIFFQKSFWLTVLFENWVESLHMTHKKDIFCSYRTI